MGTTYFVVSAAAHDALVGAAFRRRGYFEDEVEGMVRLCREAAWHGIRTHNALKALHLEARFGARAGGCVPGAPIERLPVRFPSARVWRAHRKLGPAVAYAAMEECVGLAGEFGVGMVSVDEAWHYLWGGAYALAAAARGFIGYTQCTSLLAEVVPFGGRRAALGTNPHSWAFPTVGSVGFPVLVDFATSAIAMGRVEQCAREGVPLPPGAAVDGAGRETTDPAQVAALLPLGGHKGYGLGMLNELMAGVIGGWVPSERGRFERGAPTKRTPSFFFLALHPEALAAGGDWAGNLAAVVADIRGQGNEGARLPGQIEAEAAKRSTDAGGLLFTAAELDGFDAVADACGKPRWDRRTLATAGD